jgi:hypothetical protein
LTRLQALLFFGLSAFVGVTDWCSMGLLPARAP